jgi:hypothetical protein
MGFKGLTATVLLTPFMPPLMSAEIYCAHTGVTVAVEQPTVHPLSLVRALLRCKF